MVVQQLIGLMLLVKFDILIVSNYEILGIMDFYCREVTLYLVERKCLLWLSIWENLYLRDHDTSLFIFSVEMGMVVELLYLVICGFLGCIAVDNMGYHKALCSIANNNFICDEFVSLFLRI